MEIENDIPPPPYSEVDPSIPSATPETSIMGGGDHSPTSTLRPTSSQSMRAPSFITLRGGWLRGVPFDEDPATASYFQGREFEFDPSRKLVVLHREITSDTTREHLPYPDLERNRDVSEQDWSTLVNYILTELGTETSVRHRKKLSAEEFYERQTKLEALIAEWNEAFFQPRSIKFIAHYYHKAPQSSDTTRRSRRGEQRAELRRIEVVDGSMDNTSTERQNLNHQSDQLGPSHPQYGLFARRGGFDRGGLSMRGGQLSRGGFHGRGAHGHGPFSAGGFLGTVFNAHANNHEFANRRGHFESRRRHHEERHGRRDRGNRNASGSSSSSDSSSSDDDTDTEHRNGVGREVHNDRRGRGDHKNDKHRRRSHSVSSDSSLSSVSSISSKEIQESSVGVLREAIANFRLDPTNNTHNRVAYKELLKQVREKKKEALRARQSGSGDIRKASKADRKAIRDDLRSVRSEAKQFSKRAKQERKAARKESRKAHKEARKANRIAKKAGKKATRNVDGEVSGETDPGIEMEPRMTGSYNLPGSYPNINADAHILRLQEVITQLEDQIRQLSDKAERDTQGISHEEKRKLARAEYDREIAEIQDHIASLRSQMLLFEGTPTRHDPYTARAQSDGAVPTQQNDQPPGYGARASQQGEAFGRYMENWGEQFGRDMGQWGENFGREMERWGNNFGQRMSARGRQIGQRFA